MMSSLKLRISLFCVTLVTKCPFSSSVEILNFGNGLVNKSELLTDITTADHGLACNEVLKLNENLSVLGIDWNPAWDVLQFQVSLPASLPNSKRAILSTIAKLFDPLGRASSYDKDFHETIVATQTRVG